MGGLGVRYMHSVLIYQLQHLVAAFCVREKRKKEGIILNLPGRCVVGHMAKRVGYVITLSAYLSPICPTNLLNLSSQFNFYNIYVDCGKRVIQ